MMSEDEIRQFVNTVTVTTDDTVTVTETITARWLQDRADAAEEAVDDVYEERRDSWGEQ